MDFLPKELEDIIMDYKLSAENYTIAIDYIINYTKNNICAKHFNHNYNISNELNDELNNINQYFSNTYNFTLNIMEIYNIIIKNLNPATLYEFFFFRRLDIRNSVRIENLPIEFVREFQDKFNWMKIGSGGDYTKILDLPIEFVREFKDRLKWDYIDDRIYENIKIETLPIEFVREFQDKFNWENIGSGILDYARIENLPINFVREFKDRLNWTNIGSGILDYTYEGDLPVEFVREFRDKIKCKFHWYVDENVKKKYLPKDTINLLDFYNCKTVGWHEGKCEIKQDEGTGAKPYPNCLIQ